MHEFIDFAIKECERFIEIYGGFGTHKIVYVYYDRFRR